MRRLIFLLAIATALLPAAVTFAYPLDGQDDSCIRRLEGYRNAQATPTGPKLAPGQRWGRDQVRLHLVDYDGPDFDALDQDAELVAFLNRTLKNRDASYSMVLVDFTNTDKIRWAGLRPDLKQNPGSVGKLVTMAALFHALAQAFPDHDDRRRVLCDTVVAAGHWVYNESHKVPKWNAELGRNQHSVIVPRDEFRLSEWLDHAISASANGAGAIVWREAMLLSHFGSEYPRSREESDRFFATTPKSELAALALAVSTAPLAEAGIDVKNLQQGSLWTGPGKRIVPGTVSFATPRELARLAWRIEQGRLVDPWSSLEMKKYMYLTKRRYRYAYAPELAESAVFFKSGSLYSCRQEEGFRCGKYLGNVRNMMNSVTTVEAADDGGPRYIAALMSNVLRFNSAWDHSRIAAAVHHTFVTGKMAALRETAPEAEIDAAGRSE